MTIQPAGNPLWTRGAGIAQYGGDLNKKDFGGIGSINARTDVNAAQHSRLTADLAALARVSPLMRLVFVTGSGTVPVVYCAPTWGPPATYDGATPISANYPSITGSGTSRTVTLPTSVADDYGVVADVHAHIVYVTGGIWDGTSTAHTFVISGITEGSPVSVSVW